MHALTEPVPEGKRFPKSMDDFINHLLDTMPPDVFTIMENIMERYLNAKREPVRPMDDIDEKIAKLKEGVDKPLEGFDVEGEIAMYESLRFAPPVDGIYPHPLREFMKRLFAARDVERVKQLTPLHKRYLKEYQQRSQSKI